MAAPAAGINGIKSTFTSTGTSITLTGAQLVGGTLISSSAGATSITFPTGTQIETAATAAGYSTANYTYFNVTLIVENTTGGNTYTFTGNTGIVDVGFDFAAGYTNSGKRIAFMMRVMRSTPNTWFVIMNRTMS